MNSYKVNIVLDRLICHEEGDGSGNSEPFIWAAFFKIDSDTAVINTYRIEGKANIEKPVQIHFSSGSHNNLSSQFINIKEDGMDAGNDIPIPATVGSWSTTLIPTEMPNPDDNRNMIALPGVAGVFYMLLEEDEVPDIASLAGQNAFNAFFEEKINYFFRSLDFPKIFNDAKKRNKDSGRIDITPTPKDMVSFILDKVQDFKNEIRGEGTDIVTSAITKNLSFFEMLGAGYDPDDVLGDGIEIISNMDLDETFPAGKNFSKTWGRPAFFGGGESDLSEVDGSYTLTGYIRASQIPDFTPPLTDTNPQVKGATVYKDVNFEGKSKFLKIGKYSLGERSTRGVRVLASSFDNEIDSIKVDSGYYAQVFKTPDFTGEMIEITHDTPVAWFDDNWRDQISSIIVGSLTERIG